MFYYFSFLRPPPLQAYPAGTISITPQIANDLRTELFTGSQDIFYAWSESSSPRSDLKSNPLTTTKPLKLTTWRHTNAYKEIPVPLPPGIREGQIWSLILTEGQSYVVDLEGDDVLGKTPFPVISMPILFSSRNLKVRTGKQEQIERVYRFATEEVAYLTVREQTSFDLDKKIWDSGVGLSSWLLELREDRSGPLLAETLKASLFSCESRKIIELGAGSGIVTLTLAALRSVISPLGEDRIISTDLASAMPLLEHNISANAHLYPASHPQAAVLDWDEDLPDHIQAIEGGFDAIVMADITYNTSSFPPLIRTLSNLIRMSATPPVLLLGYKERDAAERTLWGMAKTIGVVFERAGERHGSGGASVEIWIGMVESPDSS